MKEIATSHKLVRFGIFEVDLRACELRKQGRKIRLQEQPCQILALLLERPGEMVSREEIRKRLWPDDTFVDFDHSLNTAVMRLRETLGDSSENPRYIETLPRRGYRFIAHVDQTASSLPEENHSAPLTNSPASSAETARAPGSVLSFPDGTSHPAPRPAASYRRKAIFMFCVVGATALVAGLVSYLARNFPRARVASNQIKSLVVLPLENLSGDREQEYFADGMTDELIAHLSKIRSLRVISRTSAMEYKGARTPLSEIARDLNVDAVVEGTVVRSGNRVRITAELVQVAPDRNLWAETYESPLGDILTLQSQVATAIANEIRIKLTPEEEQRLASVHPISTESYEDYLKGRYYWNKRSEEGLTKAIDYFELATKKDPNYALAYAGLADCYSIIGSAIVGTVPSRDVAPKAKAAALKALELDGTLAEAQTSLATVRFNYDWDWAAAATGFNRAIELNPSYATAYQRFSLYLMAIGRTQESIAQMNRARDLEPLSISTNFSLGWRLYMARQYDQAIEQLRNTIEMDPNFALSHLVLGQAYEQKKSYDQAIAEFQKAASISHDSVPAIAALGHAYAIAGRKPEAQNALDQLLDKSKKQYVSPFYVAIVYVGLNENEKALDSLEKAYEDRSNGIVFLKVDPQLDALRPNPRFRTLLQRLALPD
jgi:TolB-like protein/DNA-binding winged helix-turn-helix (wHTH) protein/Tfp pilus assembly protein PilF